MHRCGSPLISGQDDVIPSVVKPPLGRGWARTVARQNPRLCSSPVVRLNRQLELVLVHRMDEILKRFVGPAQKR
jgi:hypothetical protein